MSSRPAYSLCLVLILLAYVPATDAGEREPQAIRDILSNTDPTEAGFEKAVLDAGRDLLAASKYKQYVSMALVVRDHPSKAKRDKRLYGTFLEMGVILASSPAPYEKQKHIIEWLNACSSMCAHFIEDISFQRQNVYASSEIKTKTYQIMISMLARYVHIRDYFLKGHTFKERLNGCTKETQMALLRKPNCLDHLRMFLNSYKRVGPPISALDFDLSLVAALIELRWRKVCVKSCYKDMDDATKIKLFDRWGEKRTE